MVGDSTTTLSPLLSASNSTEWSCESFTSANEVKVHVPFNQMMSDGHSHVGLLH
jgi:hypothetical protein